MAACRNLAFHRSYKGYIWNYCVRSFSSKLERERNSEIDSPEIIIPHKIQREPTDILKALSTTVKKDYTAAKYKYEDDPYFIPVSNVSKRSYALSKESGKKAARYFLEKFPDLFLNNKSVPLIKQFQPPTIYTEDSDVTEDTLKSCITSTEVNNSMTVYELLKEKNIPMSQETKQLLLQLLCFYNCDEAPSDYTEDRWYAIKDNRKTNTWKADGFAEKLFEQMNKDNAAPYCAMIQGCAKYYDAEKAFFLYEEMCGKGLTGTVETYNSILSIIPLLKQDGETRWEFAQLIVNAMNDAKLSPNLNSLNALLSMVTKSKRWNRAKEIILHLLAEMKMLNIEPSLATYYYVLDIFHYNAHDHGNILAQIMNRIDGQVFEIRHPDDVMFFHTAMDICNTVICDKDIAHRINALLELGNNCSFIGSSLHESIYFRHYFTLLCQTEAFETFMETYEKYVPHSYTPEPIVMLAVLDALEFSEAYTFLPRLCSDIMLFEQTERENVLGLLLKITANAKLEEKEQQQLVTMVFNIVEKLDKRSEVVKRMRFEWTSNLIYDALKIFLNAGDLEKSGYMIEKMFMYQMAFFDLQDPSLLIQYCSLSLNKKDFKKTKFCLSLMKDLDRSELCVEVQKIAEDMMNKNMFLEKERSTVQSLFTQNVLQQESTEYVVS